MNYYSKYIIKSLAILFLLTSSFSKVISQTLFKGDADILNPIATQSRVGNLNITTTDGQNYSLKQFSDIKRKFSDKPFLIFLWGTGDGKRGLNALKDFAAHKLGDEYNVVALFLGELKYLKEALDAENLNLFGDQFLLASTTWDEVKDKLFVRKFPMQIFTSANLEYISKNEIMPYSNTKQMLSDIYKGHLKTDKVWFTKEGYVTKEADENAIYYQQYALDGNYVTAIAGDKNMLFKKQRFIKSDENYLWDGAIFAQTKDGVTTARGNFKNGLPIDSFLTYFSDGKIRLCYPVNGIHKIFDEAGRIKYTGPVVAGLGNGVFNTYSDGQLIGSNTYKAGEIFGIQKKFFENGKISERYILPGDKAFKYLEEGIQLVKKNDKYGFIDRTGKLVIPLQYEEAEEFKDGKAKVSQGNESFNIDKSGVRIKEINWTRYEMKDSPSEGITRVKLHNKFGFVNEKGVEITAIDFDNAENFKEGFAAVKKEGKTGFINNQGKLVIPYKYIAADNFENGKARVGLRINDKNRYGFIDKTGKEIIPVKYNLPNRLDANYVVVKEDKKNAVLDWTGKIIQPAIFDFVYAFSEGMAKIEIDGKFGFLNEKAEIAIPAIYEKAENFKDGAVRVFTNMKWITINKKGEIIK